MKVAARLPAAATTLLAFALLATWTSGAHGDVLVDTGRELYLPWRICEGDVLYRDLAHFSGPFSPYWNALWIEWLGNHVRTLELVNLAILLATVTAMHSLLRRIAGRGVATLASLVQLAVFSFAQFNGYGIFDWVLPYAHELTHGVALAIAALWMLRRWEEQGDRRRLFALGCLLGVVALTKPEPFLALGCALGVGVPLAARRRGASVAASCGIVLGAAMLPSLLATALFATAVPARDAMTAVATAWSQLGNHEVRELHYYRSNLGIDEPLTNLAKLGGCAAATFALLALARVIDRRISRSCARTPWASRLGAAAGFVALVPWILVPFPEVGRFARGLPAVVLALAVLQARQCRRDGSAPDGSLTLGIFGAALLGKMLLATRIDHYGFALAMPGTLFALAACAARARRLAHGHGGTASFSLGALCGCAFVLCVHGISATATALEIRNVRVGRGADAIAADPARGETTNQVLAALASQVAPGATLAVLPEGATLNWFLGVRSSVRYVNFMPPELVIHGETSMLAAFAAQPPDFVVLAHKFMPEYGVEFFGGEFGGRLLEWVRARYRRVGVVGYEPLRVWDHFGFEVLSRK